MLLFHLANGFKGMLAAITSSTLLFAGQIIIVASIYWGAAPAFEPTGVLLWAALFLPIALGFPLGIIYGNRKGNIMGFALTLWAVSIVISIPLVMHLIDGLTFKSLLYISVSLFLYCLTWTWYMDVIKKNPLSFEHFAPENPKQRQNPGSYIIKKKNS
jgi:predicted neutral ceramidase superfamily lipid hydrolase